jgi:hypothetical protein
MYCSPSAMPSAPGFCTKAPRAAVASAHLLESFIDSERSSSTSSVTCPIPAA